MTLSPDQKNALQTLLDWYFSKDKAPFITLGGYAGTGKTTLIAKFRSELNKKKDKLTVVFCSYTGKATRVLQKKLEDGKALQANDSVSTIHSLMYQAIKDKQGNIITWEPKESVKADLIVVDEASMVDRNIWSDLLKYQIPILAVGDHGQLPPINGSFNLMDKPVVRLNKIHRQAENNPIIKLSIDAREKGYIKPGNYGPNIMKILRSDSDTREIVTEVIESFNDQTLLLCGYNHTRVKLNTFVRESKQFFHPKPVAGDRVICLKNNHQKNIYNGMLGTISHIEDNEDGTYYTEIYSEDSESTFYGTAFSNQFNNISKIDLSKERINNPNIELYDFGYCITVHKAQGSQAKRVILFEERFKQMSDEGWRRWLYTGVTRAEEELFIVGKD